MERILVVDDSAEAREVVSSVRSSRIATAGCASQSGSHPMQSLMSSGMRAGGFFHPRPEGLTLFAQGEWARSDASPHIHGRSDLQRCWQRGHNDQGNDATSPNGMPRVA